MGNIEQAQTLVNEFSSMAAVGVLHLRHCPSPKKVQQALNQLQQRHPLLQMKIMRQNGALSFVNVTDCPPLSINVIEADGEAWRTIVQTAINQQVPHEAPLLHFHYLHVADEDDRVDLVAVFHHAMMDAFSGINLLEEMLLLLSGQTEERAQALPLLEPCEVYFPPELQGVSRLPKLARFMSAQMGDEFSFRFKSRNGRTPPIHQTATCTPLVRRLSPDQTRALTKAVRRHDVTINSALSAAQLMTVHKHLYDQQALPLRTMIFANLRPYLKPAISKDNLGCYITPTRQTVAMPTHPDFWQIAQTIQQNLTNTMRRGDGFLNALMSKMLVKMITGRGTERFAATAISYAGPLPLRTKYGGIELLDMHAFLASTPLGPEFFAFSHIFKGELIWDFAYLDADMDAEMANCIADEICNLLIQTSLSTT